MPPAKIMLIRHGEKPKADGQAPFGVDENGVADFYSLSVRGWQRAGALIDFFVTPRAPGSISTPDNIYAATPKETGDDSPHGRRAIQTVTPLARTVAPGSLPNATYGLTQEPQLIEEVRTLAGVVLIAWEHKRISAIVSALRPTGAPGPLWDGERFDMVWVLDLIDGEYSQPVVVPQMLLDGDMP